MKITNLSDNQFHLVGSPKEVENLLGTVEHTKNLTGINENNNDHYYTVWVFGKTGFNFLKTL